MPEIRINRYLSICGVTSRRKADDLITAGRVRVNGNKVNELGTKIDPSSDLVTVDNINVSPEKKKYIKLYKPPGYVTTLSRSERGKNTIQDLISGIGVRVYPVGRLDYDVEGLILLTNDGYLAHRIHHPANRVTKIYNAEVEGELSQDKIRVMKKGKKLTEGFVKPDAVVKNGRSSLTISFHEGKKHLVKRYLAGFGHPVKKLKRTEIGGIKLGNIKKGEWKELTSRELKTIMDSATLE